MCDPKCESHIEGPLKNADPKVCCRNMLFFSGIRLSSNGHVSHVTITIKHGFDTPYSLSLIVFKPCGWCPFLRKTPYIMNATFNHPNWYCMLWGIKTAQLQKHDHHRPYKLYFPPVAALCPGRRCNPWPTALD